MFKIIWNKTFKPMSLEGSHKPRNNCSVRDHITYTSSPITEHKAGTAHGCDLSAMPSWGQHHVWGGACLSTPTPPGTRKALFAQYVILKQDNKQLLLSCQCPDFPSLQFVSLTYRKLAVMCGVSLTYRKLTVNAWCLSRLHQVTDLNHTDLSTGDKKTKSCTYTFLNFPVVTWRLTYC